MSNITIITNNVPRDVVYGYEVSAKVRVEFNYVDWASVDSGEHLGNFVQYKGSWFDLDDFMVPESYGMDWMSEWSGYASDSFFSGVLVRYVGENCEQVVMGRYYS